ncbi:cystatin-M [Brienomyrus brachyistius]|uniref:cystatin-M n=1 Tax=Brienomyrus brachyistius TaxID=42636 RepID=UPI0020B1E82B|nr:cystatin-M [Brienomyrus brachyistius]
MMTVLILAAMMLSLPGPVSSEAVSPSSPEVLRASAYAIRVQNQMNGYPYAFKVTAIQSASAQLYPPARVKYWLRVQAGQTVCKNEPDIEPADCALRSSPDAKMMTCDFVVLMVPYSDVPSHLLENRCSATA